MRTPDLTQRVIGFRQWKVDFEFNLSPVGMGTAGPWAPGPQHAVCWAKNGNLRMPCLPVADPECECGFYGLFDLKGATSYGGYYETDRTVQGIVTGWGRLAVHHVGFRAEWIEVMAIIVPDEHINALGVGSERFPDMYREVAKKYNIPCMDYSHAESFAKEFGSEMPESLKPTSITGPREQRAFFKMYDYVDELDNLSWCRNEALMVVSKLKNKELIITNGLVDVKDELDPGIPEAMAGLYDIYVPNWGDLITALNYPPDVNYIAFPKDPIVPLDLRDERYLMMESSFMFHIATTGQLLWLPANLGD